MWFSVGLPPELVARVDVQADKYTMSRSGLVRLALEAALDRMEDATDRVEAAAIAEQAHG